MNIKLGTHYRIICPILCPIPPSDCSAKPWFFNGSQFIYLFSNTKTYTKRKNQLSLFFGTTTFLETNKVYLILYYVETLSSLNSVCHARQKKVWISLGYAIFTFHWGVYIKTSFPRHQSGELAMKKNPKIPIIWRAAALSLPLSFLNKTLERSASVGGLGSPAKGYDQRREDSTLPTWRTRTHPFSWR